MVKHLVLLRFKTETSQENIGAIYAGLAGLIGNCSGLLDFAGGPYSSPEGLNRDYTHAFIMSFDTEENRDVYLDHPDHEAVKQLILPHLEEGGVIAFDFVA